MKQLAFTTKGYSCCSSGTGPNEKSEGGRRAGTDSCYDSRFSFFHPVALRTGCKKLSSAKAKSSSWLFLSASQFCALILKLNQKKQMFLLLASNQQHQMAIGKKKKISASWLNALLFLKSSYHRDVLHILHYRSCFSVYIQIPTVQLISPEQIIGIQWEMSVLESCFIFTTVNCWMGTHHLLKVKYVMDFKLRKS